MFSKHSHKSSTHKQPYEYGRRRSSSFDTAVGVFIPTPTPAKNDGCDSSGGELSSPETNTEHESQLKTVPQYKGNKKHRKKKKTRIVTSPPTSDGSLFFEDDIKHRDGGATKKFSYEHDVKITSLIATKIEKSSSFKRKTKPVGLEGLMSKEIEGSTRKLTLGSRSEYKSNSESKPSEYNIILLGDFGVGKTALAVRFVTRRYLHEYDPTLERAYEKYLQYSAGNVRVRLWDTVNKSFESFTENADAFLVLFSITSLQSCHNAQNTIKSIRSSKYAAIRTIPIMLVGTKSELEHARKVKTEEQEKFARQNGCSFKEISVACTINIDNVIKTLVEEIYLTGHGRLDTNGHNKLTAAASLARKPSGAKKHIMKNLLSSSSSSSSSKKKEKS